MNAAQRDNSAERFTQSEWKVLQNHGARLGAIIGLMNVVIIGAIAFTAQATGAALLVRPHITVWVLWCTVPVAWLIGWWMRRRLPADLLAKSRGITRRTWWMTAAFMALLLGASLLGLGQPAWVGWIILPGMLVVALLWAWLLKRVMVDHRPGTRASPAPAA